MNEKELQQFGYEAYHAVIELLFAIMRCQPPGTPAGIESVKKATARGNAIIARWENGNRIKRGPESDD
jgi:hypothetical protein